MRNEMRLPAAYFTSRSRRSRPALGRLAGSRPTGQEEGRQPAGRLGLGVGRPGCLSQKGLPDLERDAPATCGPRATCAGGRLRRPAAWRRRAPQACRGRPIARGATRWPRPPLSRSARKAVGGPIPASAAIASTLVPSNPPAEIRRRAASGTAPSLRRLRVAAARSRHAERVDGAMGRSSATGTPLRVTTKVSPAVTASVTLASSVRSSRRAMVRLTREPVAQVATTLLLECPEPLSHVVGVASQLEGERGRRRGVRPDRAAMRAADQMRALVGSFGPVRLGSPGAQFASCGVLENVVSTESPRPACSSGCGTKCSRPTRSKSASLLRCHST